MSTDQKQRALIRQWRQSANEATTADAAVTYHECADALEIAIAKKKLIAICEGCGATVAMSSKNPRKAYTGLPTGWSQCGTSKHRLAGHGVRLAAWCPSCRRLKSSALPPSTEP